MDTEKDTWAIVDLLGRTTIAGKIKGCAIPGEGVNQGFLSIDVPFIPGDGYHKEQPMFTKIVGANSIYAIEVSTETEVRAWLEEYRPKSWMTLLSERNPLFGKSEEESDEDPVVPF